MAIPTYTREQLITLISTKLAGSPNTIDAVEHRELETAIVNAIYGQIGDIKEISCNTTYITNNFKTGTNLIDEGLGLPSGERYGWAICNGKNGTVDKRGNVSIGYDPSNYATLASTQSGGTNPPYKQGGDKEVQLSISQMPTHSHDIQFRTDSSAFGNFLTVPFQDTANSDEGSWRTELGEPAAGNVRIREKGGNQAHPNMQPYIVTLFIQRIPV